MNLKSIPRWSWIATIVILLLATERMPYGYYTLTRIVVCGFAAYLAYAGWNGNVLSRLWSSVFCLLVVLFNPVVPVYLSRRMWYPIDVGVALVFAAHLVFVLLISNVHLITRAGRGDR
jgi:hypothetical protein